MTIGWLTSLWRDDRRLRHLLLVIDVGLLLVGVLLIASIIDAPPQPHSDGFEIFAALPLVAIVLFLDLPALLLLIWNRTLRISALLPVAAVVLHVLYWSADSRLIGGHCVYAWDFCVVLY